MTNAHGAGPNRMLRMPGFNSVNKVPTAFCSYPQPGESAPHRSWRVSVEMALA